jgi:hypothetical protein
MDTAATIVLDRFRDLFLVLEDLIKRVADTDDPTIRHMRARLREDLIELKGDMTPIEDALRAEYRRASEFRHPNTLRQPALAALTGVAVALTVLRYADGTLALPNRADL